jgi:protein-S-isoprenylcysteine O-methyltransferase Ste14
MADLIFPFSAITLFLSLLLSTYLSALCFTSPNPPPRQVYKYDRVGAIAGASHRRNIALLLALYHAILALTFPFPSPQICPYPSNLNLALFTWSPYTVAHLFLIVCVGAPIRLTAYGSLGKNFTFRLAIPDRLVTTGIYNYIQHPSYTGQLLVLTGNLILLTRWDASVGCWMPRYWIESLEGWGWFLYCLLPVAMVWGMSIRVRDEEAMLKEKFGKEWEQWHRQTKRFIPGVF